VFTFGTLVTGAALLTVLGWSHIISTPWLTLPSVVWVTIFYTAVFASAATFTLLQFAALRLPSSKVMAYTFLTPAWVIVWNVGLGAALPPLAVGFGVAMTIIALVLLLRD